METLSYHDFERVAIHSGTVVKVELFSQARKLAYKVWVDFGTTIGVLQTSAQVTKYYTPETLVGKQVLGCINLGEKTIAGFMSQFLLLGFSDGADGIYLATIDPQAPNGSKIC